MNIKRVVETVYTKFTYITETMALKAIIEDADFFKRQSIISQERNDIERMVLYTEVFQRRCNVIKQITGKTWEEIEEIGKE